MSGGRVAFRKTPLRPVRRQIYLQRDHKNEQRHHPQSRLASGCREQLDDEKDVNPLDVLFSPDTDFRELGLHGHDDQGRFVAGGVLSGKRRDGSTYSTKMTTLRIQTERHRATNHHGDQVPPNEDAILTLKPNTRYLERQRDMLMMLRDRPCSITTDFSKLTEVGTENQRKPSGRIFHL